MTTSPVEPPSIVAFITARLDDRQLLAVAAAADARPRHDVDGTHWRSVDGEYVSCEEATLAVGPHGFLGDAIANHVVANDPGFVFADVAAKRALLALWQKIDSGVYSPDARQVADDILEQLLAPYGKRAVWTRDEGWQTRNRT